MKRFLLSTCVAAGLAVLSHPARADITIGFISSLSGNASSIGIQYAKGIAAAYAYRSEMAGQKIRLVQLDDASDPSLSARDARKLIEDEKIDVLIGTATVPSTVALATVASELKVPMIAVSPLPPRPAPGTDQWSVAINQPASMLVDVIAARMTRDGVKTVGYIGFSDSWGDLVYTGAKAAEERGDFKVLANERYARNDTSVTGQILKVMVARPQAVLDGGSGTQGALPLLTLGERGYKGGLYGTAALVNADFVRVAGKAAEGIQVTTGPVIAAEQLPDGHYAKALSLAYRDAYQKANGALPTDGFSAYSFDAWLVVDQAAARAIKVAQPGTQEFRAALKDEILRTHEQAGTQGVYNFKPGENYGVDDRSLLVVRLTNGIWKYVP